MPSEKLIKILRSKTDLTDEQIIPLTDEEGWAKVYEAEAAAKAERDASRRPTFLNVDSAVRARVLSSSWLGTPRP